MRSTKFLTLIFLFGSLGMGQQGIRALEGSKRVDVGGYRLRVLVTGQGNPTVVLESASGSQIEDNWAKVLPEIAKLTRVVAYDRAGVGESEAGQRPRTAQQIATELPYILVGHSIGGPYIRVFAHRYPTEVAGMVFVDPTLEPRERDPIAWAKVHLQRNTRN